MATKYTGASLAVFFGTIDISGYARSVELTETAAAPETIDVTVKGDTARQILEGFPGAVETNVTMEVLDIYDALHAFGTMILNTKNTLFVYPKGKTHTYPVLTVQNARLHEMVDTIPFDGAVSKKATWNAKNTLTRGTYSTAA